MANEFVVKNGLISPNVQLQGSTSGSVTIAAPAVAGTTSITLPSTAGTLVTTGDTGTVTNTMLAGSIANAKLVNSAVTVGSTSISLGASSTTLAGLTSVTSTTFVGALTGNASTATTLQTARTIALSGDVAGSVSFDGSANATISATIQPDSVALGTDTTGNYMVNVSAGTGVTVSHTPAEGSTATVSIGQAVGTTDNVTFNNVTVNGTLTSDDITSASISVAGNATITGNLTVSGTTTTINSTTIAIADLNLELARNAITATQANGAGITVTGPTTAATLTYSSTDDRWNFNKNLNITRVYGTATNVSNVHTAGSYLTGGTFDGSAAVTWAVDATPANTFSKVVARDSSGNFSASTITAALAGNASTASSWQNARTLSYTGDVTGSMSVDGSVNVSTALTLAASGVTAGTYNNVTVNSKGLVTSGSNVAYLTAESDTLATVTARGATTSSQITVDSVITTNNGNGTNIRLGDDVWIGDVNLANTFRIRGNQDAAQGYITFGSDNTQFGRNGTGALTWGGNTVWHAGNLTNLNQLTNGPGYITGYTETDTLASVTGRGFTSRASSGTFATATQGTPGLEIYGGGTTEPAYMTFHRPGVYAVRFGLDGSDLKVGGWSMGAVSYKMWHEGNLTNLNQLANGPGYITGYTETDTLASVTARGATTSTLVRINNQLRVGQNTNGTAYIDAYDGYAWFGRDSNTAGVRIDSSGNVHATAQLSTGSYARLGGGTSNPTGTTFSHTLAGVSTNRIVNFDGNGNGAPSVWWTSGSRAYGAIDAKDPGLTFWANNGTSWQQQFEINYGNVTVNTDIRSPIFYDSNDTTFYLDPNSSGTSLYVNGSIISGNGGSDTGLRINHGNGAGDYGRIRFYQAGNNNQTIHVFPTAWQGGTLGSASAGAINLTGANGVTFGDWNNIDAYFGKSGNLWVKTKIGIGVDAGAKLHVSVASPSGAQAVNSAATVVLDNTGNNFLQFRNSADNNSYQGLLFSDNNQGGYVVFGNAGGAGDMLRLGGYNYISFDVGTDDSTSSVALRTQRGYIDTSSNLFAFGSMRSPIFYDYNDTGYYCDPNSTTRLASLTVVNTISGNISGNADTVDNRHADYFYPATTDNGYSSGDINGNTTHQRLWAPDTVQDMFAFNPPTTVEYSTNGSSWTSTSISSDVFSGKMNGQWGGFNANVGDNIGAWRYVRLTWQSFGYRFFSHFTLAHSTNGHSFNLVFYKSSLDGTTWTEAFRQNGISSWPGYTVTKHSNVSGWWDTRDIRIVLELNYNTSYPNNAINIGHIGLHGSYGGFNRLFDWNGSKAITFNGNISAPILYDSNDTGYYVDPNSTSNLSNVVSPTYRVGGNSAWKIRGNGGNVQLAFEYDTSSTLSDSNIKAYLSGGTFVANGDIRAPVFYDSDNTGFYINAASSSNLNTAFANYFCGNSGNAYGIYKGYDNNNHFIAIRGSVSGNTTSPTITGAHHTTFVEYAEANDGTGWFFKTAATGNYDVVSRITRSYSYFEASVRSPLFYDSNDTTYYVDPANGGFNLRGGSSNRVTYVTDDSGIKVNNPEGAGGSLRLGAAWGRIGLYNSSYNELQAETTIYFRIANSEKGYIDSSSNFFMNGSARSPIFYDSNDTAYYVDPAGGNARISRDLYISGNTGGNYGNRLIVGNTDTVYTLQDTNARPTIQAHGQYPVLSLNHTVTSNTSHGPTVQFTANGTGRQFVIGMNGTGTRLDIGVSNSTQTNWNPHNGIGDYEGITGWRMDTSGNTFSYVSDRSPIFYDNNDTAYYADPNATSVFNGLTINGTLNAYANAVKINRINFTNTSGSQASDPYCLRWRSETDGDTGSLSWLELQMNDDDNEEFRIYGYSCSGYGCGQISSNLYHRFYANGNAWHAGNVTAYSDIRVKDNISIIDNAIDKVMQIRGVTFTRNDKADTDTRHAGVIAQEVEAVLPEVVDTDEFGMKSVAYGNMVGLLIEAIKEQQKQIEELKGIINEIRR